MSFQLPDVNPIKKAGGKVYYYHRKTRVRIMGEYGTPEFLASYLEASRAEAPTAVSGTFNQLLLKYEQGADFRRLAPGTKITYGKSMKALRERYGKMSLKAMEKKAVRGEFAEWRDELIRQGKAGKARNLMVFSQTLFQWGEDRNFLDVNRLRGMKQLYKVNRADKTWEPEQITKILKVARADVANAIITALWTGQRQSDLCKAAWADIQKQALIVEQLKTGAVVGLPLIGGFSDWLDSLPRQSDFILNNSQGLPWRTQVMRQGWRKALADAGFDKLGLRFHDLRGTTITTLADMGATEAQIASISGHTAPGEVRTLKNYLRKTHTQALAAMELLNKSWIGQLAN